MFLESGIECVGRATDFLGDLSDEYVGIKNTADGVLSNFGTVMWTRHGRQEK